MIMPHVGTLWGLRLRLYLNQLAVQRLIAESEIRAQPIIITVDGESAMGDATSLAVQQIFPHEYMDGWIFVRAGFMLAITVCVGSREHVRFCSAIPVTYDRRVIRTSRLPFAIHHSSDADLCEFRFHPTQRPLPPDPPVSFRSLDYRNPPSS